MLNFGGSVDTLVVAGRTFLDLANLKVLLTRTGAATSNGTFRELNASAGYQVPNDKKFVVKAIVWGGQEAAGNMPTLCYSDNDVGVNSSTAFTNVVNMAAIANNMFADGPTAGSYQNMYIDDFEIPAGKYIGVADGNTTDINLFQIFGYEVLV